MTTDEYIVEHARVREFIAQVRAAIAAAPPEQALEQLRPHFAALLADQTWLPDAFRRPVTEGGMGGGIATWLLFRAADADLSLFSLVVPPGAATPIHDHLAWGLIGLHAGEQDEEVFRRADAGALHVSARNHLRPGDAYVLLPPDGDIHRVLTTSAEPSISIHLLGNDTGCVTRHTYDRNDGSASAFRSGWSNVACGEENAAAAAATE